MSKKLMVMTVLSGVLVTQCGGGSGKESVGTGSEMLSGALQITTALALSETNVKVGDQVKGTVTYTNPTASAVTLQNFVVAARPPGGSHAGGPYDDFGPYDGPVTLAPGQSVTVTATRTFTASDPTGPWDLYSTYEDSSGTWFDGPDQTLLFGSKSVQDGALEITSALSLSESGVSPGDTVTGTVTFTNDGVVAVNVENVVIAARPPGGTHSGGPYDDFGPTSPTQTLAPGASLTLTATRTFSSSDPTGTWDLYPTWEDGSGVWHDGTDASIQLAASSPPSAYYSTHGNQLVDGNGNPVRLASVGWNDAGGVDIPSNVAAIAAAGFNAIRLPWYNASMAGDLARYDQVIAAAGPAGLRVILDNHANEGGPGADGSWRCDAQQANGLWYDVGGASNGTDGCGVTGTVTDATFLADWVAVAQRYAGNTTVIGFDLRNEPLAYSGMCTWGDGNFDTDIRGMYERVGNAILAVDPGKLIITEGPQDYSGNFAGTGPAPWGDLSIAGKYPVVLNVPNKLVYSIHDYPLEIAGYSPDNGPTKVSQMNADWGYLVAQGIAPVWIGEMGSSMDSSTDAAWAQTLVDYTNGNDGALGGPTFSAGQKGIGTDWWAWGYFPGELPDGTQNADGSLKSDQYAVYSQLR
ncbi:MAG TPA: cellulase family glycosylhydrolase [Polyangiaceae bacterium]|jgi:uncharacterized repeat protein (TIGR01451 family)